MGGFEGARVLVVDDDILVSWTTQDLLEDLGCVVVGPAASVSQALSIIAAEPVKAAVLDINLGTEKSYPIADALASRGVPFLFVTGYDPNTVHEGYRTAPILQKPLQHAELARALAQLLALTSVPDDR